MIVLVRIVRTLFGEFTQFVHYSDSRIFPVLSQRED